jgi:hypothetical protein
MTPMVGIRRCLEDHQHPEHISIESHGRVKISGDERHMV